MKCSRCHTEKEPNQFRWKNKSRGTRQSCCKGCIRGKCLTVNERFWAKVTKTNTCWVWTAAKWPGGQGTFSGPEGKLRGAHRYAWEKAQGPVPSDMFVCHSCENLACVNPDHLYLGDQKDAHRNAGKPGATNPMYGKRHTAHTKALMSKSRTGKTGDKATAWKGGRTSVNRRVRGLIHTRLGWYAKVYHRDRWICQACGEKAKKIDAHHIRPLSGLIRQALKGQSFQDETQVVEWLVQQPEIADLSLTNGITLCRKCHKETHNWGSRTNP